jgi:hypothetical protein
MRRPFRSMTSGQKLGRSMQLVLNMIRNEGPITDAQLCARIDLPDGAIRPARLRLCRRGLVEKDALGRGWVIVPPERQEEVQEQAQKKPPRRRKLSDLSVDERVTIITTLLRDDEVNRALHDQAKENREWRRARARARDHQGERDQERRERRAEAARAAKEKSIYVDFLKTRNHLKDAVEVILGVRRFLNEDLDCAAAGEAPRIPASNWPDVLRNVTELLAAAAGLHQEMLEALDQSLEQCPLCGARHSGEPAVIDAEVVSELVELTSGKEAG